MNPRKQNPHLLLYSPARAAKTPRTFARYIVPLVRMSFRSRRSSDRFHTDTEQKKIEQTVSEPAAAKQTTVSADAAPAEDEKRTTLSLSLTVSDKKALKMMAVERETTIAAIIHEWVAEHARKD